MDRIKVSYVLNYCVYDSPLFAVVCGVMARLATVKTRTTSLGIRSCTTLIHTHIQIIADYLFK